MSDSNIRFLIAPVLPYEAGALLRLYVDLFYDREPLTACLGLSRERMAAIAESMHLGRGTSPFASKLYWVAKDREAAGTAIGFIVCDDPANPDAERLPPDLTEQEQSVLPAVMALLAALRAPVVTRISKRTGECLHVAAIGIAPGYEGMGLATRLLRTALSEAYAAGFRHAFAECTGPASRRCHEKCGFISLYHLSGDAWTFNGNHPFAQRGLDCHMMWKDLP